MTKSAKGTALVTGASSGIGAIYADRLARRGYDLILVARNRERLDGLARRLVAETGRSIEIVAADLSKRGDVSRIESILRDNAGISVLVNNAGVGATAPLLASDVDKMSDMIALNVDCADAPDLCGGAGLRRARRRHHRQHRLRRGRAAGAAQRASTAAARPSCWR
jgi:short-subunit dehydrogenase